MEVEALADARYEEWAAALVVRFQEKECVRMKAVDPLQGTCVSGMVGGGVWEGGDEGVKGMREEAASVRCRDWCLCQTQ